MIELDILILFLEQQFKKAKKKVFYGASLGDENKYLKDLNDLSNLEEVLGLAYKLKMNR